MKRDPASHKLAGVIVIGSEANRPASMGGLIEHETGNSTNRTTLLFGHGRLHGESWAGMGGRIGNESDRRRDLREARDDP